ncbi:hypothetical protein [Sphingopyxis sp. H115]|uniref:hypothetical protein n=1 Tax=Sphingopyxis sp. H115 TaxID=1759073 RepID=UPI00128F62EE|nr:hypothetical protein [Sphingopyxis sp. H115]
MTNVTDAKIKIGEPRRAAAMRAPPWDNIASAYEMGAGIAANPHYPALPHALHLTSSRSAFLAISGPQNDALRRAPEQSGDGLVGPLSGAGRTWKALHHLFLRLPKQSPSKRWTAFPVPGRVRLNSWESLRSVTWLSVAILVGPFRSLLASLATTLDVPAVRRLCRPMI